MPVEAQPADDELFFALDAEGVWRLNRGDLAKDIEAECAGIKDSLVGAIFGDPAAFQALLSKAPEFLFTAGLSSAASVSSADFERVVAAAKEAPPINRLLYLADCRKLVSAVRECSWDALVLQGEFYRALNLDGASPAAAARIHATLGFLFVRLHNLLDHATKLAFEAEHLRTDFSSYPRLASTGIVFGDRKRLGMARVPGTLFEACDVIAEVELCRNHVVQDGLFDDRSKIHELESERFVLLPDMGGEGRFEKFKNRNLFYSRQDRINLRLPGIAAEFQHRLLATLGRVRLALSR